MDFRKRVQKAFNEQKENGFYEEACLLNQGVGTDCFETANPNFLAGDINSELVLIHLNPKRIKLHWNKKCDYSNFQSYWHSYQRFGKKCYCKGSERNINRF